MNESFSSSQSSIIAGSLQFEPLLILGWLRKFVKENYLINKRFASEIGFSESYVNTILTPQNTEIPFEFTGRLCLIPISQLTARKIIYLKLIRLYFQTYLEDEAHMIIGLRFLLKKNFFTTTEFAQTHYLDKCLLKQALERYSDKDELPKVISHNIRKKSYTNPDFKQKVFKAYQNFLEEVEGLKEYDIFFTDKLLDELVNIIHKKDKHVSKAFINIIKEIQYSKKEVTLPLSIQAKGTDYLTGGGKTLDQKSLLTFLIQDFLPAFFLNKKEFIQIMNKNVPRTYQVFAGQVPLTPSMENSIKISMDTLISNHKHYKTTLNDIQLEKLFSSLKKSNSNMLKKSTLPFFQKQINK